ncbi:MAG: hypothetical protein LBQ88_06560 [Treponema sp.]|jgi:hypothetical protein|nr:hypothetical protein [Treponema sp.]
MRIVFFSDDFFTIRLPVTAKIYSNANSLDFLKFEKLKKDNQLLEEDKNKIKEEHDKTKKERDGIKKERDTMEDELYRIRNGYPYRMGKMATFLPRKIKTLLKKGR